MNSLNSWYIDEETKIILYKEKNVSLKKLKNVLLHWNNFLISFNSNIFTRKITK